MINVNWYDIYRSEHINIENVTEKYGKTLLNGEVKTYKRGYTVQEEFPGLKISGESLRMGEGISDFLN